MSFFLECKKAKRTGFLPVFLCGGMLAALIPVLNMAVRAEIYLGTGGTPVQILMDADWQMMAMLNILLVAAGACLLYHTENADNAIQKMCTLPAKESSLFLGKAVCMEMMCTIILGIEAAGIGFCSWHWFGAACAIWPVLLKNFGYALLLISPASFGSLLIASACKNMWVSLGIGVVCVFTATMLPTQDFILSLFPFAMPFQIPAGMDGQTICHYMAAAIAETLILGIAEIIFLKVRRAFV